MQRTGKRFVERRKTKKMVLRNTDNTNLVVDYLCRDKNYIFQTFIVTVRLFSGLELQEYGNVIVTIISAGLISLILTPFLIKKRER